MGKKVKVLHIITRLIAAGADENTIYTVIGLDKNLFDTYLLIGGESEIEEEAKKLGVKIIVVKQLVRNVRLIKDLISFIKIYYLIRKCKFHIVHTHTAKAGIIGRSAAKIVGVPIIIHTLHGLTFHDFMPLYQKKFFILLEKFVARFTDHFISVGENIKKKSIEAGIGAPEKYSTIYSGMDLTQFKVVNMDKIQFKKTINMLNNQIIIGTVSRLEPRKGPQYFIEVMERVKKRIPNIKGVIVGCGSFRSHLEKKIKKLNLEENIILTGYRRDIAEIMSIFDIICLTSLWEGIPRVLIQGALLGKPLIAFNIDGNSEVIKHEVNGYLVPPIDINEFANRIIYLIENDDIRKKMSLESKRITDSNWDKDYMIKEIKNLYLRLMKNENLRFDNSL